MARALEAAAGAIYDIGYRNYEGARLGRGYAFRTLYVHSLRTAFGLRRGGKALVIPWLLFVAMLFPAVITVAVAGISGGMLKNIIPYHEIFPWDAMLLALFCASQAPELVSTDQHHRLLPLYFSRPLRKYDYAAAKLLAMWTAVFILMFAPLLVILIGHLALPADFGAAFRDESKRFVAILLTPVVAAMVMGTLSLALASLMPRRGLASAAVLGTLLVLIPITGILMEMNEDAKRGYAVLLHPILTANGAMLGLFKEKPEDILAQANLPPETYGIAVAAYAVFFTLLLLFRYRRLSA